MRGFHALLGLGLYAEELFPASDIGFLQKVWPTIRVAANFTDVNWGSIGSPGGPQISNISNAILSDYGVWKNVRRAANFTDINWHAVPELSANLKAAAQTALMPPVAQPVPELPPAAQPTMRIPEVPATGAPGAGESYAPITSTPAVAQPVPEVTGGGSSAGSPAAVAPFVPFDWSKLFGGGPVEEPIDFAPTPTPTGLPDDSGNLPVITPKPGAVQAGMFGDMKTWLIVSAAGLGLYFLSGAHKKGGRRGGRRRRHA